MELIMLQKNWDELIIKLRKKYPQLTDADLQHNVGKEESMLRMIEYKLSKTKLEMQEIIAGIGYSSDTYLLIKKRKLK
jgi:hypothetical protein